MALRVFRNGSALRPLLRVFLANLTALVKGPLRERRTTPLAAFLKAFLKGRLVRLAALLLARTTFLTTLLALRLIFLNSPISVPFYRPISVVPIPFSVTRLAAVNSALTRNGRAILPLNSLAGAALSSVAPIIRGAAPPIMSA